MTNPFTNLRGIIYRITNKLNGKVYIGKAKGTFYQRYPGGNWWRRPNRQLKHDYNRYGAEAFVVDIILAGATSAELREAEIAYIRSHNCLDPNGYNQVLYSKDPFMSEATRRLISKKRQGSKMSIEARAAMSRAALGKPKMKLRGRSLSSEHRDAISKTMSARSFSDEHWIKLTTGRMGGLNQGARAIEQLDKTTGDVIQRFESMRDAYRAIDASKESSQISRVCRGKGTTYMGFRWRYAK